MPDASRLTDVMSDAPSRTTRDGLRLRALGSRVDVRRILPEGRQLSPAVWNRRHLGLTIFLWAHIPCLLLFGLWRHIGLAATSLQVGLLVLPATLASISALSRNLRSASTSIGLVMGASVLVHLSGGSIEAHFQFFVVIAFLTLYQAWTPFLLALGYVVVEHGVIGALDPHAVYSTSIEAEHPWRYALIHGGFVLAASVANVLSWRLVEQEALHDGLTGLPNRAFLLNVLDKLDGDGSDGCAVLFIDLDHFKSANDAYGHDIGDALLTALAHRLQSQLRLGDTLARLGGDEFAVLLRCDQTGADSVEVAGRLLASIDEPVRVADLTVAAEASIGVAIGDAATQPRDLLRNADLAMYEAKRNGGGRVSEYRPRLHTAAVLRAEIETELRAALAAGDQFELYYQPILDVRSGRIASTEALLRWHHPTRGLVMPGDFIEVAEEAGLITAIGTWVLRAACEQSARWRVEHADQAPRSVAVNLSPRQLLDPTLVTTVSGVLQDNDLPSQSLCLEITEGSVIRDFDATMQVLRTLRRLGVSLALDDFGTGYSSLSYLKDLPVNSVKIDRSFVKDVNSGSHNAQIVLATINLAHALGLSVTAEGAETVEQFETLEQMGSDQVQGYLLGRPMPAAVIGELFGEGTAPAGVLPSPRPVLAS